MKKLEENMFDRVLDGAASSASDVRFMLEANGLPATAEDVTVNIARVLAEEAWNDEEKRAKWIALLLPRVREHLAQATVHHSE